VPLPWRVLVSIGREPGRRKEFVPGYPPRAEACWQRDRALAIEAQRKERLFKHER